MIGALRVKCKCHEQSSQSGKSMSALHAHNARAVTGVKNRMPKVNARWKISASKPSRAHKLCISHAEDWAHP